MSESNGCADRPDQLREVAVQVALKTGLLRRCPTHDVLYDPGQHDYQGACMVASYLVNQGNPLVAEFAGDRDPLLALLRVICTSYGSSCPQCASPTGG